MRYQFTGAGDHSGLAQFGVIGQRGGRIAENLVQQNSRMRVVGCNVLP